MSLYREIYNLLKEGRPRTTNKGVDDIDRPGSGKRQRDVDLDGDYKDRVVKKYEVTTISDKGKKNDTLLTSSEILKIVRLNPDNKNISFEEIKVGEKYEFTRTTPLGSEKKGEIILKSKTPTEVPININPEKKYALDINPEKIKSSYESGAVHEISFNNITKGVRQKVYTIYRTITEQDYSNLKTNSKVSTLIKPSTEPNHAIDVYYITIPKVKYGTRSGVDYTYFVLLKEDAVKGLTKDQKDKAKLVLVPIKDISEGISKRPLDAATFMSFLTDKEKQKLRKQKPIKPSTSDKEEPLDIDISILFSDEDGELFGVEKDTEVPKEETPEEKEAKKKAAEFMLDDKVERVFSQIIKNYDISKTATVSSKEKQEAKEKYSDFAEKFIKLIFDFSDNRLDRKSVFYYNVAKKLEKKLGLYNELKTSYENMESLKENLNEASELKDDKAYKVSVKYNSGKSADGTMSGKTLKSLIGSTEFLYNQDIPFEKVVDDPQRGMQKIKGTLKVVLDPQSRNLRLTGRRTLSGEPIEGDPSVKKDKEKTPTKTFSTRISGQGGGTYKVPINKGVKMADVRPNELRYKYYVVNLKTKEFFHGSDDWNITKDQAKKLGPDYKAIPKAGLSSYGVEIYKEELSKEDKASLKSKQISFTIQSNSKVDKQLEVKGNVKEEVFNKEKNELILTLDNKSQAIFTQTKSGNITGVYNADPTDQFAAPNKINYIQDPILKSALNKVFPSPAAESKLESYIRKRIKQALKEAEIDQYIGGQGPEVKKKRLKEYMMKYEWGFQKSEDPFVRKLGSEKHAIVSKLVNELGDEGVAIFNSYAPEGMEISSPNDLNDMADTPLGSQLHQPYDPNSLTARGGRIAEIKYTGQGEDEKDLIRVSDPDQTPSNRILVRAIKTRKDPEDAKYLIAIFRKTNKISDKVTDEKIYNTIKSIK